MTPLTSWQTVIAVAGLVVFGYGIRTESEPVRWVGIGLLLVAFAFRFLKRKQRQRQEQEQGGLEDGKF